MVSFTCLKWCDYVNISWFEGHVYFLQIDNHLIIKGPIDP